ncbi:hypothetical protein NHF46_09065 [Arthrobacter alpinus]|nr:hypothetical protein [Arthrobacter alpinus]
MRQVHAGDADEREHRHHNLHGLAHRVLGGGGERGIKVWMVDLDADEKQSRDDGAKTGRTGKCAGVMDMWTPGFAASPARCRG